MIQRRVKALRELLEKYSIKAYVIPGTDAHQNEYLPDCFKRREWICGFTGSAGSVVITSEAAGLWTDGRYFLQAEEQLAGSGITLFKMGFKDTPDMWNWLRKEMKEGDSVGIDPRLLNARKMLSVKKSFITAGIKLKFIEENLIDLLWQERPSFPMAPAVIHPLEYCGESTESKLTRLRDEMVKENCSAHILTQPDSIAWLFNIRGQDILFNPVVLSYAVITLDEARLFIFEEKISSALKSSSVIQFSDYNGFKEYICSLKDKRIWIDEETTSGWVYELLEKTMIYSADSPVIHFKAIKNSVEIENFKEAHRRDGIAMVRFLKWLEENVAEGRVTEATAAEKLEAFRGMDPHFMGPSFSTISAYGAHGAIIHYSHTPATSIPLAPKGLYLVDSGGQYPEGTTDITRTIALGPVTEEMRKNFTFVLKGHIDLALAVFPEGTQGAQLDTIARKPLWDAHLDYGHGTGHGIGSYLNVHEGPPTISPLRGKAVKLKEGMFFSNEPGYYKAGEYGIRIENVMYIVADETAPAGDFLKLMSITLCPIDLRLVVVELLTEKEREYLNNYHKWVRDTLSPDLTAEERTWLDKATEPV